MEEGTADRGVGGFGEFDVKVVILDLHEEA